MSRFPFKDSPRQALRDLFKADRLERVARNLPESSITKGEGSLELRATDDGIALYAAGDLDDGDFGFGIRVGGKLVNLQTHYTGRLDSHASRIGATENGVKSANSRLDSHASRIGSLENRMTTQENKKIIIPQDPVLDETLKYLQKQLDVLFKHLGIAKVKK